MTQLDREALIFDLKILIAVECDRDIEPSDIATDAPLISDGLGLDSLDALQISMAVKERWSVRIENGPASKRAFGSVAMLADFIIDAQRRVE